MSEVKRYYIMESAVGPMRDEQLTYTPLVNYKTDVHVVPLVMASDYDALAVECERLREERDSFQRVGIRSMEERDAAMAELAALKGGQEAVAWYTDDHLTDRSATTYSRDMAERWVAKGWPITPLYTAPPPQPSTVALKELLPELDDALENLEIHGRHSDQGYRKLKDWYRKAALATGAIDAALAAHAQAK